MQKKYVYYALLIFAFCGCGWNIVSTGEKGLVLSALAMLLMTINMLICIYHARK